MTFITCCHHEFPEDDIFRDQFTGTLDELVSGFRFQQLQLSTTMMNASIYARLPEKLAAAEAREADEREAKGKIYYCLDFFYIPKYCSLTKNCILLSVHL